MPQQLKRLLIAFAIFISLFLVIRHYLVPKTFGKYGHYDANALDSNAARSIKYIDAQDCSNCHTDIDSVKVTGKHAKINCQTCHGPGYKHMDDPSANPLVKPTEREFCGKCHEKNAARPKNIIKQQDLKTHNPDGKCVDCHNPHHPEM